MNSVLQNEEFYFKNRFNRFLFLNLILFISLFFLKFFAFRLFIFKLLIKICQHGCTCDELSDSDALKYLFNTISSICELHNLSWRRTAADALVTLSKNFTIKAINYIHRMCLILIIDFFLFI